MDVDELSVVSVCVGCGMPMDEYMPVWMDSVNLTADTLFVRCVAAEFERAAVEMDIAFDWCSLDCFARSLFRAAAHLGWRSRP